MLAFLLVAFATADPAPYAGSAVCRTCHAAQYDAQSGTAHARALKPAADGKHDWAFGAPVHATTWVSKLDGDLYVEHRLSYYTLTKALAPTPGHGDKPEPGVLYRIFSPGSEILRCFQCHSTGTVSVTPDHRIQPSEPGVRCEVCHGPGTAHAKAPSKTNIANPGRYNGGEVNQFCGSCHRKPTPSGEATNFHDPWNARHQPLFFAESKCFQKSAGRLSCLTCHPPHGGPVKADMCATCHAKPRHMSATVTAAAGRTCISCHMPAVKPQPELSFSNHWIGIFPRGETLVPRRTR
ncbi:MAG: hypothetical protein IT168_32190 [Bryobacterales bacterium]|nr:hypothetical protein [Bryobacterales bacterium]